MERLYREFMAGKTVGYIARIFTKEKVRNWEGRVNWHASTLQNELFIIAWNKLVAEKRSYTRKWKENIKGEDWLNRYYSREFIHMVDDIGTIETMETNHMLATLDNLKVFSDGQIIISFLEGTEITIKCE